MTFSLVYNSTITNAMQPSNLFLSNCGIIVTFLAFLAKNDVEYSNPILHNLIQL